MICPYCEGKGWRLENGEDWMMCDDCEDGVKKPAYLTELGWRADLEAEEARAAMLDEPVQLDWVESHV